MSIEQLLVEVDLLPDYLYLWKIQGQLIIFRNCQYHDGMETFSIHNLPVVWCEPDILSDVYKSDDSVPEITEPVLLCSAPIHAYI